MTRTGLDLTNSTPIKSRRLRRLLLRTVLSVFTSLFVSSLTFAQDERHPQRGFNPGASYALSDMESISTTSGNVIFNVPLGSLPAGRAGSPGFTLGLTYNSKLYDTRIDSVPSPIAPFQNENRTDLGQSQDGGWRYTLPSGYAMRLVSRLDEEPGPTCTSATGAFEYQKNSYIFKVQVLYPDGSAHDFRPYGYTDQFDDGFFNITPNGWLINNSYVADGESASCTHGETLATTAAMVYYSTDGSYTRLVVQHDPNASNHTGAFNQWTLYFPDGRRVTNNAGEPQRTYDRNNNYVDLINTTLNGHPAYKIIDQFGRYITVEMNIQSDPATDTWSRQDYVYVNGTGGDQMVMGVHWKRIYVYKQYYAAVESGGRGRGNTYLTPWEGVYEVVDQVTLPAQTGGNLSYTFGYNAGNYTGRTQTLSYGWGELSSVTLPSGAKTSYGYVLDGVSAPAGTSLPQAANVLNNKPKSKALVYRQEYDLTSPVSNSPCDTNVEQCTSEVWLYAGDDVHDTDTPQITSITGPDGGVTSESFDTSNISIYYSHSAATVEPDGTKVERLWQENRSTGMTGQIVNPFVKTEYISVMNAAGTSYVKTAIKDYTYDKNGNGTSVSEYDWVDYASVPRDAAGRPSGLPQGITLTPKKVTANRYYNPTPDASDTTTVSPNAYYQSSAPQWLGALRSSEAGDSSQILARTELYYDDAGTTGNLTEQRSWDSTKGALLGNASSTSRLDSTNSISVFNEYDPQTKNRTATIDAMGTRTTYVYGAVAGPSGTVTDLYPTEIRAADGTTVQRKSLQEYDFYTGLVTKATDADNNVSTAMTYDVFGRPTLVKSGLRDGQVLPEETHTATVYSDIERRVIVRSDLNSKDDGKLVTVQHYDQLGRVRLTHRLEDSSSQVETDETAGIKVQTRYMFSGNNSYTLTSNPYRAANSSAASGETTMGWTVSTSDQAGRVVRLETFDGAALPAPFAASNPNTSSSGAVVTSYDAEKTTVTDQALNARQSVMDGLGRLSQVVEALGVQGYGFQTSYTYNALGNLTQVSQDVQTRTFSYSSLSRLTSTTNPEVCQQGQTQCAPVPVTYTYDAGGNLLVKTDARGVSSHYEYDALNRVTRRWNNGSSAPTATVNNNPVLPAGVGASDEAKYFYDSQTSQTLPAGAPTSFEPGMSVGRLVAVTYGGGAQGSYTGQYDAMGRPKASYQVTDTGTSEGVKTYSMGYGYNLAGGLTSETYPSNRKVVTEYDAAGRVAGVQNQATGLYYAGAATDSTNRVQYTAAGAASLMKIGNGLWEHTNYNSRLQPTQIGLGTSGADSSTLKLDYAYGVVVNGTLDATKNNGNVQSQTITVPGVTMPFVQSYKYDQVNRLATAEETIGTTSNWKQVYYYDQYGNRNLTSETTYPDYRNTPTDQTTHLPIDAVGNPVIDPATNRISVTAAGQGNYQYDAAGNLLCDPGHQCVQGQSSPTPYYAYDAENKMKSAGDVPTNGGTIYTYDGSGQRVKKASGAATTVFVYDAAGKLVAEYGGQPQANGTSYITQDSLSSTRAVTGQDQAVKDRHDYFPFGEEIPADGSWRTNGRRYGIGDSVRQKFTGKERDIETGLDYFGARYYGNVQGRFISPDPLLSSGRPDNPQTWNRYSYTVNNPLCLIDPAGLFTINPNLSHEQQEQIIAAYDALKAARSKLQVDSKAYKSIDRALKRLGNLGEANGIVVTIGKTTTTPTGIQSEGETGLNQLRKGVVTIIFNEGSFKNETAQDRATILGHEAVHADDAINLFSKVGKSWAAFVQRWNSNDVQFQTEYNAYWVNAGVSQAIDSRRNVDYGSYDLQLPPGQHGLYPKVYLELWNPSYKQLDQKVMESRQGFVIQGIVEKGYGYTLPKHLQP